MRSLTSIPLTRRGWTVTGCIVVGLFLGVVFGPRSLNAVLAPALVVLGVALWRVRRRNRPDVSRTVDDQGTIGERTSVTLEVQDPANRIGTVVDTVSADLRATDHRYEGELQATHDYTITLHNRGSHSIGPATITLSDVFGLAERTIRYGDRDNILVVPRVFPLTIEGKATIGRFSPVSLLPERDAFEGLRQYRPEDSLRDVHWPSSAKRPDGEFVVTEYASEEDRQSLTLSGEATAGADDVLADALASLGVECLVNAVDVTLVTPNSRLDMRDIQRNRSRLLEHLAHCGPGTVDEIGDIHVVARSPNLSDVQVQLGDTVTEFTAIANCSAKRDRQRQEFEDTRQATVRR